MKGLFVTGAYRSGTTLLGKLLNGHPSVNVADQPFPLLFVATKEAFHLSIQYNGEQLPLANFSGNCEYAPEDVTAFLREFTVEPRELYRVYERLEDYSGTQTHLQDWRSIVPSVRAEGVAQVFVDLLPAYFANAEPDTYVGSKEILCEEFIPYFLENEIHCIAIIRDPRDMICSLNGAKAKEYVGDIRPTLFNIHNWRKSVAFALQHSESPFFHWLRYEDLVSKPHEKLRELASFLQVDDFHLAHDTFTSSKDVAWEGNSSFAAHSGVSAASVGRYETALPKSVVQFVEATCFPEMKTLRYSVPDLGLTAAKRIIDDFREPYEISRSTPSANYSNRVDLKAVEKARLDQLFER